jgi:iodotyrosine deiodinase
VSARFVPLAFDRLAEDDMRARSAAFLEALRARRTIRSFSSDPIPLDVVENAVAAAATAPSGANQQPWTFVVVTDPNLKREIRDAAEAEERRSYGGRMPEEWLRAVEPFGTDANKPHLVDAPVVIAVFEQAYGRAASGEKVKHYYVRESVGIAVGFLIAALNEAGLASLVHTPSPMGFLNEILARPDNERAYLLLAVGYPAEGAVVPVIDKKTLDQVMVRR